MTVSTLAVSTCILWGIFGFGVGVASCIALGMYINKKNAQKNEKGEN